MLVLKWMIIYVISVASQNVDIRPRPIANVYEGEHLRIHFSARWNTTSVLDVLTIRTYSAILGNLRNASQCTFRDRLETENYTISSSCYLNNINGSLVINKIEENHQDLELKFELWLKNLTMAYTFDDSTTINVLVPVKEVSIFPSNITMGLDGNGSDITCTTSPSRPPANVTWMKTTKKSTSSEIIGFKIETKLIDTNVTKSTLTYHAAFDDGGFEIYCEAFNGQDKTKIISSAVYLSFIYGPKQVKIYPPEKIIEINETEILNMYCTAECKPECSYRWIKDGYILRTTSNLTIYSILYHQNGNYTCEVKGYDMNINKTVNVAVVPAVRKAKGSEKEFQLDLKTVTFIAASFFFGGFTFVVIVIAIYKLKRCKTDEKVTKREEERMTSQLPKKYDGSYRYNLMYIPFEPKNVPFSKYQEIDEMQFTTSKNEEIVECTSNVAQCLLEENVDERFKLYSQVQKIRTAKGHRASSTNDTKEDTRYDDSDNGDGKSGSDVIADNFKFYSGNTSKPKPAPRNINQKLRRLQHSDQSTTSDVDSRQDLNVHKFS